MILFEGKVPKEFFYDTSSTELIISKEYFILYKQNRIYYCQKNQKVNKDDFLFYINKNFGYEDIKINYEENIKLKNKNLHTFFIPKKSHFLKVYIIYLFLICTLFYIYDSKKPEANSFLNIIKENDNIKKEMEFNYLSKNLLDINEKANKSDVHILSLHTKYSKIFLELQSYSKDNIHLFLDGFYKNKIEKIEYDEKTKRLKAYVSFRTVRK